MTSPLISYSIHSISTPNWLHVKQQVLSFVIQHSDRRITKQSIHQLISPTLDLQDPGTQLLIASRTSLLEDDAPPSWLGLSLMTQYGQEACFVVVHPACRGQQVGTNLLRHHMKQSDQIVCQVALDNVASIRMCFNAGLIANRLTKGPTGKPTLIFICDKRR